MNYRFTPKLQKKIDKLIIKDKTRAKKFKKKISEILRHNEQTINHYKNLKRPLQHLKRVHIDSHFVLTFEFKEQEKLIIFTDFEHHDRIYSR
jgi:mRNA-degrading endonuclease RelE of RelBE toxin-antitoxin system